MYVSLALTQIFVHICIYIYVYIYICIYIYTCMCIYIYMCIYICICIYVYAHIHVQTRPPCGEASGAALEDHFLGSGLVAGPGASLSAPRRPLKLRVWSLEVWD